MLRRHGCALLVKMALRQPRALLPMFDHLRNTVVQMRAQGQVSEVLSDTQQSNAIGTQWGMSIY